MWREEGGGGEERRITVYRRQQNVMWEFAAAAEDEITFSWLSYLSDWRLELEEQVSWFLSRCKPNDEARGEPSHIFLFLCLMTIFGVAMNARHIGAVAGRKCRKWIFFIVVSNSMPITLYMCLYKYNRRKISCNVKHFLGCSTLSFHPWQDNFFITTK